MWQIETLHDSQECQKVWEQLWPCDCVFDLWQVRECFLKSYNRPLHFIVAQQDHVPKGMIALCRIEEEHSFAHFPGETWKNRTWLEQNRLLSGHPDMSAALIEAIPGPANIRYLTHDSYFQTRGLVAPDEIGYVFIPQNYGYVFDHYLSEFSGKTRKKINAELTRLENQGVSIEHNRIQDVNLFLKMNIDAFGEDSYFSDQRFLQGFEALISFLAGTGMLRVTTVLIGGKVAAVDIGAVFKKTYTLLAGGTDPEFKGVAKLINLHHMNWACRQKLKLVDFLCGDFNWKERFHLTPKPLYALNLSKAAASLHAAPLRLKEESICA